MAASIAASMSSTIRTVVMSERSVGIAVWAVPSTSKRDIATRPIGKTEPPADGDGGGDGPTVLAEADLEVRGVVRIDSAGGEDVAESFDGGVHPLAGTGVSDVDAGREEAIRLGR